MRRPIAASAISVLLLLVMSCGGAPEPAATTSASSVPAPTGTKATGATATAVAISPGAEPRLTISSPRAGATVAGDSITVSVDVENFNVVSKIGGKNMAGEGHLYYYLDVEDIPTQAGDEAVSTGEGRYVESPSTTHTWNDLVPGDHLVAAQLVNNNHTPLQPPVTAQIQVRVGG